jgi:hypothetical protein
MRLPFLSFLFLIFLHVSAQFNSEFLNYSDFRRHVSVAGEAEWNSNAINNNFVRKIYRGGYLDAQSKDAVSSSLLQQNIFGALNSYGLSAFFGKDSSRFDWFVGVKNQEYLNTTFTKDLFRVVFYGNEEFRGKYATITNSSLNYMKFQEVKLGFVWKNVDTVGKIGGALSFISGQRLLQYKTIDTNFLYTAPDATQLLYQANFSIAFSDTNNTRLLTCNGTGLSADVYVETPYQSRFGKSRFIITVNNLGFIRWNQNTIQYRVDSVLTFNGVHLNNFLDINDSTLNLINADTVMGRIGERNVEHYNVNLPMNFLLIHETCFNARYCLRLGLRQLFNANYKPFFFVENKFNLSTHLRGGVLLSYGGYGKFSGGIYVEYNFKDHWIFRGGSNAIQGFTFHEKTFGGGAYLTLVRKFK